MLALADGSVVSADELADAVWGDDAVHRSRGTLQVYVSNLRKALDAGPGSIVGRPPGYALDTEIVEVDAGRFARAVEEARRAAERSPSEAMDALTEALSWWRGPLAADLGGGPSLDLHRDRLTEMRLAAEELRWEAAIAAGRHAEVLDDLELGCRRAPLREQRWASLMVALYRSDRQAGALEAYQQARAVLVDELGLEPGPRLRRLEQAVLVQADSLLAPTDEPTPSVSWIGPDGGRHVHGLDAAGPTCVIGRDPDQTDITLAWDGQASRIHAELERHGSGWRIVDRASTNGTFRNGSRIGGPEDLVDGDVLRIGETQLLVRLGARGEGIRSLVVGDTIPYEG